MQLGSLRRWNRKPPVVARQPRLHELIGGLDRRDTRQAQVFHQAILQGLEQAFDAWPAASGHEAPPPSTPRGSAQTDYAACGWPIAPRRSARLAIYRSYVYRCRWPAAHPCCFT
jgi:hypothetical protein